MIVFGSIHSMASNGSLPGFNGFLLKGYDHAVPSWESPCTCPRSLPRTSGRARWHSWAPGKKYKHVYISPRKPKWYMLEGALAVDLDVGTLLVRHGAALLPGGVVNLVGVLDSQL